MICIAGAFSHYDERAVKQIERNIELIRYRIVGSDLLLLKLLVARSVKSARGDGAGKPGDQVDNVSLTPIERRIHKASAALRAVYEGLRTQLSEFGDDVQIKVLRQYVAFKRIKNFACIEVIPTKNHLLVYAKLDPEQTALELGFTRDVTGIGHFGTGDVEITITSEQDVTRAMPLLQKSYDQS